MYQKLMRSSAGDLRGRARIRACSPSSWCLMWPFILSFAWVCLCSLGSHVPFPFFPCARSIRCSSSSVTYPASPKLLLLLWLTNVSPFLAQGLVTCLEVMCILRVPPSPQWLSLLCQAVQQELASFQPASSQQDPSGDTAQAGFQSGLQGEQQRPGAGPAESAAESAGWTVERLTKLLTFITNQKFRPRPRFMQV